MSQAAATADAPSSFNAPGGSITKNSSWLMVAIIGLVALVIILVLPRKH